MADQTGYHSAMTLYFRRQRANRLKCMRERAKKIKLKKATTYQDHYTIYDPNTMFYYTGSRWTPAQTRFKDHDQVMLVAIELEKERRTNNHKGGSIVINTYTVQEPVLTETTIPNIDPIYFRIMDISNKGIRDAVLSVYERKIKDKKEFIFPVWAIKRSGGYKELRDHNMGDHIGAYSLYQDEHEVTLAQIILGARFEKLYRIEDAV